MNGWRGTAVATALAVAVSLGLGGGAAAGSRLASQGVQSLKEGGALDLDRGRLTQRGAADIRHTRDAEGRLVLAPGENVLIGLLGDHRPGRYDCFAAKYVAAPVRMHRLRPTRYFCVKTNRGRFAALRVLAAPGRKGGALKLEHRTFAKVYSKTLR